ncbi:sensor histidine kinase [Saccharospirillum mangrovi]|uniref:sensor histidine kinase n=1 Tax=Saccharospirillum mangrovi TaxID=2161747 RepID=UPI000D361585|nr:ATP-binding protein [Saccharospirillum mangrovi]
MSLRHTFTNYRFWVLICFISICLFSWGAGSWAGYRLLERESLQESFRYSQLVANELNRYRPIPELMAEHPLMRSVLEHPDSELLVLEANEEMKKMASIVASSDVYLMDRTGLTIAANNYQLPTSFIGRNFAFRPYFHEAMASADSTIYFALGITTDQRGLYFSHPVTNELGEPLGVVVIKIQVTDLEDQWQRPAAFSESEMVVLDLDGISFLASRPAWLYRAFEPISDERRLGILADRRYHDEDLTPMTIVDQGRPIGVSTRSERLLVGEGEAARPFLSVETPLPQLDWTLRVLIGTEPVLWTQVQFLVGGTLVFLGGFLTWLYVRERYRREAELAERGEQLEQRVAERTADLESSNQQLLAEIAERERAELELKETQQELIQAAKLAVLGQMSAGLNHEMNQPLTAIQAYARNSRRFLERGENETVDANLHEIVSLCDRMAELTRQFKVFARKSEGRPSLVDMRQPIDGALKIISAQDNSAGVQFDWQRPQHPAWVHGDLIRIEQVLVNLIANAAQATETVDQPQIQIDLRFNDACWQCRVRDNGPGLPANTEQLFEPFFTTKSMKQGLGLGLSISRQIVDALGGKLVGQNRRDGQGAEFILTLTQREGAA